MTDTKTVEVTIEQLKELPTGTTITANHTGRHATLVGPFGGVARHLVYIGGISLGANVGWTFDVDEDVLLPGEVVTDLSTLREGDVVMVIRLGGTQVTGPLVREADELLVRDDGRRYTARGNFQHLNKQVRLIERAPETITVRKDDVEAALKALDRFGAYDRRHIDRLREAIKG